MNFDINRLTRSYRIIGGGAIAFFIFLFIFKWYGASASLGSLHISTSANGWHSFTNSRWIWLLTIIVALAAVAIESGALNYRSPVQPSVVVAGLGALSTLLILYRIVHHPTAGGDVHVGIKIGIWLGLIAAAAVTYGGYLAMTEEGTSLADVREQASGALGNLSGSETRSTSSPAAPRSATPQPPAGSFGASEPAPPSASPSQPPAGSFGASETPAPPLPPPSHGTPEPGGAPEA